MVENPVKAKPADVVFGGVLSANGSTALLSKPLPRDSGPNAAGAFWNGFPMGGASPKDSIETGLAANGFATKDGDDATGEPKEEKEGVGGGWDSVGC